MASGLPVKVSGVPDSDVPKYESGLKQAREKVEHLRTWKGKIEAPTPEFREEVLTLDRFLHDIFDIFRDDPRFFKMADELVEVILETRNYLGKSLMPLEQYPSFARGVFQVGNQTIFARQYYEEIPFYGPPRPAGQLAEGEIMQITKFYEWKIIDCPRASLQPSTMVKCIYYLEKGQRNGPYYVLGMSAPGMHATIQNFPGARMPTFFELEMMIVKRLLDEQQGKRTGYAAASFKGRQGGGDGGNKNAGDK